MEQGFYQERLRKHFDIDVVTPKEDEQVKVHDIIYEELCQSRIEDTSRRVCLEIIGELTEGGAEGIILGCTELPLLISPGDVAVPVFDTTRLHAEAAVEMSLTE
jgi:aspartate racemase